MRIIKLILLPITAALILSSAATNAFSSDTNYTSYQEAYNATSQQDAYAKPINVYVVQPYYSSVDEIIPSYPKSENESSSDSNSKDPRNFENWEIY